MRFALAIVSLFPWGGLQRDCLRIARSLIQRGHEVRIFASRLEGTFPPDLQIERLPALALTNHGRNRRFADALAHRVANGFDRIVGFDKLPGLDVLYCADPSVAARVNGWRRRLPRYRTLLNLEAACFGPGAKTRILALAERQIDEYRSAWNTDRGRITLLPPAVDPGRRRLERRSDGTRERMRADLGLPAGALILLAIGAQPRVKGMDRAAEALAKIADARLLLVGLWPDDRRARHLVSQANTLGVAKRIHWLGPREDIPEIMAAADILIHPARLDTTGTVILEAVVNALPVITTAVCGFAVHVQRAEAGFVLDEPFAQAALDKALAIAADARWRERASQNAGAYGADPGLYRGIERAVEMLEG